MGVFSRRRIYVRISRADGLTDASYIQYHKFRKSDFSAYQSWFSDPELNQQLGPIDKDWLDYILNDATGVQYCFTHFDALIAVVGISNPTIERQDYVVTDIAVRPDLRRQGLGRIILHLLPSMMKRGPAKLWRAYVNPDNRAAIQLFESSGWARMEKRMREDDMIIFEYLTKD